MKKITLFLGALLISMVSMAAEATISFADVANRKTLNNDQQVWEQNGLIVTGNKSASTTNVADYSNPARFYQGSSLTIKCTLGNITKIVIDGNNGKPVSGIQESIGDEATLDGNMVTVIPTETSDTYVIEKFTAQVRINAITVTYAAAGETPETPEEPENPEEPEQPNDSVDTPELPEGAITCAEAVAICQETGETATSVEYTVRGYVTNIKYAWSEKFGTATFWIADTKDGGDVLQAYNCAPLKDADKVFAVGAYVELVGKLKKYGTTNEVEKGTYTVITPAEGGQTPDDGGETPVDTITVAAGLALTDNATCVLNPFTVIYVSGAYVYIEDESAYALLYQYESGLKAGDQVSGMEVTKTTYQDIAQFKPTTMENLTIVAGTAPAIDEITTAPTVADNHLVKLMNVTLAGAIAAGKTVVATCNDNTTINIYSKFDFTIEEGKSYNIIGGVTQYNGTIQIQAYEVEETIGAPSAIDNITIDQNAVKFIENGQLVIVKDGVRYNALGQVTK